MVDTYIWLAVVISIMEAGVVAYRYRSRLSQGSTLFYAVGSGLLTFILVTGLAQLVWRVVIANAGSGPERPDRDAIFNLTTLAGGAALIVATGVVTAGATLAGVRAGRGLSSPAPEPALQPVTLPMAVAGVPLARLRQMLTERLDANELNNLAFDLGVDLDSLPTVGTSGRVRELLEYLHRRGELERVVVWVREHRPDVGL